MKIGEKIAEMLKLRQMTQADLAKTSGLAKSLVSELVNGKKDSVNMDTVIKLAKALNVHPNYLIEENTIGPAVILEHLDKKHIAFVSDKKSAPYIVLSKKAAEAGVSPHKLEKLLEVFIDSIKSK